MTLNDEYEMRGIPKVNISEKMFGSDMAKFIESNCATNQLAVISSKIFLKD